MGSGWKAWATVRGVGGVLGLESPSYGEGWGVGARAGKPELRWGLRGVGVEGSNRGIGRES